MRLKKIATIFLSALCLPVFAGWSSVNYEQTIWDYDVSGKVVARWLSIPHASQPNGQTCGATNTSNAIHWLSGVRYDILSVYNYINTNGIDGIQTDEIKAGLQNIATYTNSKYQKGVAVNPSEAGHDDVESGVLGIFTYMRSTKRPVIIIGNKKGGLAGMHYHMPYAAVYYKTNAGSQVGVWLNDSMYNSPSYPGEGVSPNTFLTASELSNYWGKTGAPAYQYWLKRHLYLTF